MQLPSGLKPMTWTPISRASQVDRVIRKTTLSAKTQLFQKQMSCIPFNPVNWFV